jgi:hypothetical protein
MVLWWWADDPRLIGLRRSRTPPIPPQEPGGPALNYSYSKVGWPPRMARVTPAMEARVAEHVWSAAGIAGLLEAR